METEYIKANEGEFLDEVLKRMYGDKNIPSNVILDKTLTGIGATYTELHSKRNSIIIEPNVPVIIDKAKNHNEWLTIYSAITVAQIRKYLKDTKITYKKILTTPEGFKKIRKAANEDYNKIQETFFCLFDECEKLTQDCDYRATITQPIYDFFEFRNKAFVSATPLEVNHPKFKEQNFKRIKIEPLFNYRKNLRLIVTNSYEKTVKDELEKLKDSQCICIFLNSVSGINMLVNSLKIMDDSYIFCSDEGVTKLKEAGFDNAHSEICYPLKKYNLFTARFYSALDINLNVKPDVLILTNLNQAYYTMIDPLTEAIQIQGRFRNKFDDGQSYNSLTHITNTRDLKALSEEDVSKQVDEYITTYKHLLERYNNTDDTARKKGIEGQLKSICEDYLLDEKGNIDYFGIDNKYNEERVKNYYYSAEKIYDAYRMSNYFNAILEKRMETVGQDDIFRLKYGTSKIVQTQELIYLLKKINDIKDISFKDKERLYEELGKTFDFASLVVEAYKLLDFFTLDIITTVPYTSPVKMEDGVKTPNRKIDIKKILEKVIKDRKNENKRFSLEVLKDISSFFTPCIGQKIAKEETTKVFEDIYKKHGILHNQTDITAKVNQSTIEEYYKVTPQNKEKPNKWLIKYMLPQYAHMLEGNGSPEYRDS